MMHPFFIIWEKCKYSAFNMTVAKWIWLTRLKRRIIKSKILREKTINLILFYYIDKSFVVLSEMEKSDCKRERERDDERVDVEDKLMDRLNKVKELGRDETTDSNAVKHKNQLHTQKQQTKEKEIEREEKKKRATHFVVGTNELNFLVFLESRGFVALKTFTHWALRI